VVVIIIIIIIIIIITTLGAGLLAGSQYSEGPTTGHLNTGFSAEMVPKIPSCHYMLLM